MLPAVPQTTRPSGSAPAAKKSQHHGFGTEWEKATGQKGSDEHAEIAVGNKYLYKIVHNSGLLRKHFHDFIKHLHDFKKSFACL